MNTKRSALIIIDIQNDYFPGGRFPLWGTDKALENIETAIGKAKERQMPIVLVQHISTNPQSPFFLQGTLGAKIHERITSLVPNALIVIKEHADSFYQTSLESTLSDLEITDILVCGMMTQNCVTHTAISKSADKYQVCVLGDCCASVSEMIHAIALRALITRIPVISVKDI